MVQKSSEVDYCWSGTDKSRFTESGLFLESGYSRKSWENKILGYWDGRPAIQLSWVKLITGGLALTNQGLYRLLQESGYPRKSWIMKSWAPKFLY